MVIFGGKLLPKKNRTGHQAEARWMILIGSVKRNHLICKFYLPRVFGRVNQISELFTHTTVQKHFSSSWRSYAYFRLRIVIHEWRTFEVYGVAPRNSAESIAETDVISTSNCRNFALLIQTELRCCWFSCVWRRMIQCEWENSWSGSIRWFLP